MNKFTVYPIYMFILLYILAEKRLKVQQVVQLKEEKGFCLAWWSILRLPPLENLLWPNGFTTSPTERLLQTNVRRSRWSFKSLIQLVINIKCRLYIPQFNANYIVTYS